MWFDAQTSGLIGGILGATVGVCGGVLGTVMGIFARKGKYEKFALISFIILVVFGAISLCVGTIALIMRQPWHVWYPFILIGGLLVVVFLPNYFSIKKFYANAKLNKKLDDNDPTHPEA